MEIRLRAWQSSDLDNLIKYANNHNVARNLMDRFPHPYTENDGKAFLEYAQSGGLEQVYAIEVEGQAVGGISIEPQSDIHRKNAELGY